VYSCYGKTYQGNHQGKAKNKDFIWPKGEVFQYIRWSQACVACPGGWTSIMRRYFGCRVIAVDRSEVDPTLMKDTMVDFANGDAFTFEPPDIGEEAEFLNPRPFWRQLCLLQYYSSASLEVSSSEHSKLCLNRNLEYSTPLSTLIHIPPSHGPSQ